MKRYDELVSQFMQTEFVTLRPSDRLDFADDVMKLGRIRHMPVVEGNRVVGVVSQRDLLAASLSRVMEIDPRDHRSFLRSVEISEVMSKPVITIEPDRTIREAGGADDPPQDRLSPGRRFLGTPVGLITETDLLEQLQVWGLWSERYPRFSLRRMGLFKDPNSQREDPSGATPS
jgi:CBS domain-containing protein